MFLKNKNIIFKIRRSKVTDYAALNIHIQSSKMKRCLLSTVLESVKPDIVIGKES